MYLFYHESTDKISRKCFRMDKPFNDVFMDYLSFVRVGVRAWIYDTKGNLLCGREDG